MDGDRLERDDLGEMTIVNRYHGLQTVRAIQNFHLSGHPVHRELVHAFGDVKLAAAVTNRALGIWAHDTLKAEAIERACRELSAGQWDESVVVDSLQGGAGTSTNMNVNEVLANRALELLGDRPGNYERVSPLGDINRHQSTNDTFPTALRVAAIRLQRKLERELVSLQEAFQSKEQQLAHVVKVGRTEYQDAVLTTLGREMGAYAEAINRDRWRIYKAEERLRVVNLGGTAIGTGLGAPRSYIFRVVEELSRITGLGLSRAENLVEATQNADVFVEVSGLLKACASSLFKLSSDLRLISSGPEAGLGEIKIPAQQAGSSIMPGKVNPVILEAVGQASLMVMGNDLALTVAAGSGSLELNAFMPLIAHCLLNSLDLLTRAVRMCWERCVIGIEANETQCKQYVRSSTASVTALIPVLGYEKASEILKEARECGLTVRDVVIRRQILTEAQFDQLISPETVCRLGHPEPERR